VGGISEERWIQANASKSNGRADWWKNRSCTRKSRSKKHTMTSVMIKATHKPVADYLHEEGHKYWMPSPNHFLIFNTVLPSSTPVGRFFSLGGTVLTPRQKQNNWFEKLLLMHNNKPYVFIVAFIVVFHCLMWFYQ